MPLDPKAIARHPLVKRTLPWLVERLGQYLRLMRFDRPIGIWLLLWPVLWAVWLASSGRPRAEVFVVFLVGTVLMRAAGCVINDWADRGYDPHVRRTKGRPIATGAVCACA